jgi:hypothetical protein
MLNDPSDLEKILTTWLPISPFLTLFTWCLWFPRKLKRTIPITNTKEICNERNPIRKNLEQQRDYRRSS